MLRELSVLVLFFSHSPLYLIHDLFSVNDWFEKTSLPVAVAWKIRVWAVRPWFRPSSTERLKHSCGLTPVLVLPADKKMIGSLSHSSIILLSCYKTVLLLLTLQTKSSVCVCVWRGVWEARFQDLYLKILRGFETARPDFCVFVCEIKIIDGSVYEFKFKRTLVFTGISHSWERETNKMTDYQLAAFIESVNTWLERLATITLDHTDITAQNWLFCKIWTSAYRNTLNFTISYN